jgi:flagellar hook-basal body complex protein FliE
MAINPISAGITPIEFPKLDVAAGAAQGGGQDFGAKLGSALENVDGLQKKQADLSMQVATGELTDIHDYMIAANEAGIATQMTVAVKNKAVESFNQIMNMQV